MKIQGSSENWKLQLQAENNSVSRTCKNFKI